MRMEMINQVKAQEILLRPKRLQEWGLLRVKRLQQTMRPMWEQQQAKNPQGELHWAKPGTWHWLEAWRTSGSNRGIRNPHGVIEASEILSKMWEVSWTHPENAENRGVLSTLICLVEIILFDWKYVFFIETAFLFDWIIETQNYLYLYLAPLMWNQLPVSVYDADTLYTFHFG